MIQLNKKQIQLIDYFKLKMDRDSSIEDMCSLFNCKIDIQQSASTIELAGCYNYRENTIIVYTNDIEKDMDTFFHEFGHRVHELGRDDNYYTNYDRCNLCLSELFETEQQVDLIGFSLWSWKYPNNPKGYYPAYFQEGALQFLVDYYKDYFENDTKVAI